MTYEETKTWGYRLNQLTRWQATQSEMAEQAREWGFELSDAWAMAEVACALHDEHMERVDAIRDRELSDYRERRENNFA